MEDLFWIVALAFASFSLFVLFLYAALAKYAKTHNGIQVLFFLSVYFSVFSLLNVTTIFVGFMFLFSGHDYLAKMCAFAQVGMFLFSMSQSSIDKLHKKLMLEVQPK